MSKTTESNDVLVVAWDTCEIAESQVEYLKEEEPETVRKIVGDSKNDDKLYQYVFEDYDFFQFEWENLVADLTEHLKEINSDNRAWKAEVKNFGWRKIDGFKYFRADDGSKFLQEILPNTDCTFKIFEHEEEGIKGLKIQNSHHDSPCGGEWYYILPIRHCDECGEGEDYRDLKKVKDEWGEKDIWLCDLCIESKDDSSTKL